MKRWNMLALADRSSGYLRKDYREDVLYSFYRYRDVDVTVGRQNAVHASDALAERMLREGLVHLQQVARYRERLVQELLPPEKIDLWSAERIYSHIHQVRREVFGADALEKVRELQAEEGCDFDARGGIDQKEIMDALLEKADRVLNFEATFDWDDVGSWISVGKYLPQQEGGNVSNSPLSQVQAGNNIVFTDSGKRVALVGVDDLIVVDTGDALLVARRSEADKIKNIVSGLPENLV